MEECNKSAQNRFGSKFAFIGAFLLLALLLIRLTVNFAGEPVKDGGSLTKALRKTTRPDPGSITLDWTPPGDKKHLALTFTRPA
ncbi:MAG: hypothetical protein JXR97_07220, partial [Planctomycetes bacterium]|nr:hypothetical protein [Planctomycetota bacterium]